ncbi:MAG: methyltransferase domain-containing protein [Patescibacteria group bacterium]|nr:methyltransferase domain-containing protein [Patescibacteria group bacterium]
MKSTNKLNLGCGASKKSDYINVDINPLVSPDVIHDLNSLPYPFESNSFDLIEAYHVLEHLDKPFEVMKEMHRILRDGGILKLKVPHFSRGFTHAQHAHGFDVAFPLYFNEKYTSSGYIGVEFRLKRMELRWMAFPHLLQYLGYGEISTQLLKIVDKFISGLANFNQVFCSRIWCFWVGGFDEISFEFVCVKSHSKELNEAIASPDQGTADAFAKSWNHLVAGSIYTFKQFEDWMHPLTKNDFSGNKILELGCGNGSLMVHLANWQPREMVGVDLGASVDSARKNLEDIKNTKYRIIQDDILQFSEGGFDVVYCIGVLHHLKEPELGFNFVIKNTIPGGRFHCWVYAEEGNWIIINVIDRLRRIVCHTPWWLNKYFIAGPLAILFFLYSKIINILKSISFVKKLPLYQYTVWISEENFIFFHHIVFDQLVTPTTTYLSRDLIERWLRSNSEIDLNSIYIQMRNGNSWKFGGRKKKIVEA